MTYAKKAATPEQILVAAEALHEAADSVDKALKSVNGVVKIRLLGDYIKLINTLHAESVRLEDDFANLVCVAYGTPVRQVPLFGCQENLNRARAFLNNLQRAKAN